MFFSISKQPDLRFPNSTVMGDWIVSHDNGWSLQGNVLSKGYRYDDIGHGNFCSIINTIDQITIEHDIERSFPLWVDQENLILTNCVATGQRVWADDSVSLISGNIVFRKKDIIGTIDTTTLTQDQAVSQLHEKFNEKIKKLAEISLPLKLFVSGGIDTLCLYSYFKNANIMFEKIDYEHFEYDYFTNNFIGDLKNMYWAYNQIHHWRNPSLFATGGCGDEYMFRGPYTISIWAAWHDVDIVALLRKKKGYHTHYFLLPKNLTLFEKMHTNRQEIRETYTTQEQLMRYLIDINLNDHQHWHLGHTLTWTPFKDIELFKIMLRLDHDSLINHFITADITRRLIDPSHLSFLSLNKNFNTRQNLHLL